MTQDYLKRLTEKISRTDRVGDAVVIDKPLDLRPAIINRYPFMLVQTSNGVALNCRYGFIGERGYYCTLSDLRNLFHLGIDYGKTYALGVVPKWNPVVNTIHGGYPKKAILWDEDGNRFISLKNDNTSRIPKGNTGNAEWALYTPRPRFRAIRTVRNGLGPDMRPYLFKLEASLPKERATTNLMVRQFTGRDIGLSGLIIFTPGFRRKLHSSDYVQSGTIVDLQPQKEGETASVKMKISTYNDIYENEDHADSYIEVFSESMTYKSNTATDPHYRSPHKLIPISADTTYYLYLEFQNACISRSFWDEQPNNQDVSLMCYTFNRTLDWPGIPINYINW